MPAKRPRRSAFVPRLIVKTAILGVIPACALACGSNASPPASADSGTPFLGVSAVAYPAYEAGAPADAAGDTGQPVLGVAAVAYRAYDAGPTPDGSINNTPADAAPADARPDVFGHFVLAVTAYEVDRPKVS
ncbi:MAG: hypothetical protein ACREJ3_09635 [Polyangiaceae bacterium]